MGSPFIGSVTGFSGRAISYGSSPDDVVPGLVQAARISAAAGIATAAPAVLLRKSRRLRS
jgi:hypothetical protein